MELKAETNGQSLAEHQSRNLNIEIMTIECNNVHIIMGERKLPYIK